MYLAFWIYNDGVATIIKIAAAYGDEIGISHNDMLMAFILTQFIGFPSTIGFGKLAESVGVKRAIFLEIAVYMLISVAGFFMRHAPHFYVLAVVVGLVQGGTQALSRSLFAHLVPKARSAEFLASSAPARRSPASLGRRSSGS